MNVDLPDEVFLAVNPKGILIINPDTKEVRACLKRRRIQCIAFTCPCVCEALTLKRSLVVAASAATESL